MVVFRGVWGLRMAWVEAWMRGCMLIVSGRGQGLVLDEPERHLAGEHRPIERFVVRQLYELQTAGLCAQSHSMSGTYLSVFYQQSPYWSSYWPTGVVDASLLGSQSNQCHCFGTFASDICINFAQRFVDRHRVSQTSIGTDD